MLKEDIEKYNSRVNSRGIVYLIGFLIILVLSIVKGCIKIIHDMHHLNNKTELPMTSLFSKQYKDHVCIADRTRILLQVDTNLSIKEPIEFQEPKTSLDIIVKRKALATLRDKFLYENVLNGEILKTQFTKVSYEELYNSYKTGEECKPYFIQQITFGRDIDEALHSIFNYPLKVKKLTGQTYLLFNDGETFELEQELQKMYYNEQITLKFVDKEEKKPCTRRKKVLK